MLSKTDIKAIKDLLNPIETKIGNLQSDMTVVKKDVKKVKKIIETDFGFHENQNIYVIKHVQTIQKNLGLPVMSTVAS